MIKSISSIFGSMTLAGCSLFGIRTAPEPPHEVFLSDGVIEVRQYQPQVIAETVVDEKYEDAGGPAFRRLAGYIFGNNRAKEQVAMTAPVLQQEASNTITMTAPVLQRDSDEGWWMAFILPSDITLADAPIPEDSRVRIREVPGKKVAILRYGGVNSPEKMELHAKELQSWLETEGIRPRGVPTMASYDPPWTLWFARRNEVQIEVE